jgi:hypothetical protein
MFVECDAFNSISQAQGGAQKFRCVEQAKKTRRISKIYSSCAYEMPLLGKDQEAR